jgi:hypothetical protein
LCKHGPDFIDALQLYAHMYDTCIAYTVMSMIVLEYEQLKSVVSFRIQKISDFFLFEMKNGNSALSTLNSVDSMPLSHSAVIINSIYSHKSHTSSISRNSII